VQARLETEGWIFYPVIFFEFAVVRSEREKKIQPTSTIYGAGLPSQFENAERVMGYSFFDFSAVTYHSYRCRAPTSITEGVLA
jgi:hypothetical protein